MDALAPSGRADSEVERGIAAMFMLCCCESAVRGGVIFSLGRVGFVTLLSAASVVPRLVEDKAAPAANASRGRYPKPTLSRAIERAIGRPIPVRAQKMENLFSRLFNYSLSRLCASVLSARDGQKIMRVRILYTYLYIIIRSAKNQMN